MDSENTLSQLNQDLATEVFNAIDSNHDLKISKSEVLDWWKSNYAKINANNFFKDLDKDSDNEVSLEEWLNYWKKYKNSGNSEEDITDELGFLKEKASWMTS